MRINKDVGNEMYTFAGANPAKDTATKASSQHGKAVVKAGNLNIPKSAMEKRRDAARWQASQIVKSAFSKDLSTDASITELQNKLKELGDGIVNDRKTLKENEARLTKAMEDGNVTSDSDEKKDVDFLIAMDKKRASTNPFDKITEEEQARIDAIEGKGLTEYQSLARELAPINDELNKRIFNSEMQTKGIQLGLEDLNVERLKSSPVGEARAKAEGIMDAATKDIIGMLQNEALEHIEETAEEEKTKAKEKADKDEAQQEEIEEARAARKEQENETAKARENRKNQEALLEEAIDSSVSVAAGMSEIDRVQSEVKSQLERVINKANLLPEDLKGTQVDATK